jgi:hypothetical protein
MSANAMRKPAVTSAFRALSPVTTTISLARPTRASWRTWTSLGSPPTRSTIAISASAMSASRAASVPDKDPSTTTQVRPSPVTARATSSAGVPPPHTTVWSRSLRARTAMEVES